MRARAEPAHASERAYQVVEGALQCARIGSRQPCRVLPPTPVLGEVAIRAQTMASRAGQGVVQQDEVQQGVVQEGAQAGESVHMGARPLATRAPCRLPCTVWPVRGSEGRRGKRRGQCEQGPKEGKGPRRARVRGGQGSAEGKGPSRARARGGQGAEKGKAKGWARQWSRSLRGRPRGRPTGQSKGPVHRASPRDQSKGPVQGACPQGPVQGASQRGQSKGPVQRGHSLSQSLLLFVLPLT